MELDGSMAHGRFKIEDLRFVVLCLSLISDGLFCLWMYGCNGLSAYGSIRIQISSLRV